MSASPIAIPKSVRPTDMVKPTAASTAAMAPNTTQSAIPSRRFLRKNSLAVRARLVGIDVVHGDVLPEPRPVGLAAVVVRFVLWSLADSKTSVAELRRYLADEAADRFADVEGLRFKAWISDEATERGAIYVWESAEAVQQEPRAAPAS